mmetsp:Transcript_25310/g.49807  ORF Transcript_25310/g.49807 Transcript_25310/m.49807 type:complete len:240 (-) Transcript_25310:298-1017(-)
MISSTVSSPLPSLSRSWNTRSTIFCLASDSSLPFTASRNSSRDTVPLLSRSMAENRTWMSASVNLSPYTMQPSCSSYLVSLLSLLSSIVLKIRAMLLRPFLPPRSISFFLNVPMTIWANSLPARFSRVVGGPSLEDRAEAGRCCWRLLDGALAGSRRGRYSCCGLYSCLVSSAPHPLPSPRVFAPPPVHPPSRAFAPLPVQPSRRGVGLCGVGARCCGVAGREPTLPPLELGRGATFLP